MSTPLDTLSALRRFLVGILLLGLTGTALDLLLMGHDEDAWQLIPLVMIALAVASTVAFVIAGTGSSRASVWIGLLQAVMILLIVTGMLGVILHYRANMEFKLEMDSTLSGFALFWSVIRAKAPPALAPSTLILLGLIGWAVAFRR
jgi:hypothetical protein